MVTGFVLCFGDLSDPALHVGQINCMIDVRLAGKSARNFHTPVAFSQSTIRGSVQTNSTQYIYLHVYVPLATSISAILVL